MNFLPLDLGSSCFPQLGYFRGNVQISPNCIAQIKNYEYILFHIRVVPTD